MKNVKQLLVMWCGDQEIEWCDTREVITLIEEKGYEPSNEPIGINPTAIEFEFEDECVSLDGILSIIQSIEEAGKHEVTEVKFCTEYDEFYGEDPYSAIYLHKKWMTRKNWISCINLTKWDSSYVELSYFLCYNRSRCKEMFTLRK